MIMIVQCSVPIATLQQNATIGVHMRLAEPGPRWPFCCHAAHEQVSELEGVFQLLRCDVERLFLQAPSVDLDMLGTQLGEAETLIDEQGSTVQVLVADKLSGKQ